jgi:hypothetical protein
MYLLLLVTFVLNFRVSHKSPVSRLEQNSLHNTHRQCPQLRSTLFYSEYTPLQLRCRGYNNISLYSNSTNGIWETLRKEKINRYSEVCLNRTLNKLESCINRTLNKVSSPSICRQILCRTITWVVFLRIFLKFYQQLTGEERRIPFIVYELCNLLVVNKDF